MKLLSRALYGVGGIVLVIAAIVAIKLDGFLRLGAGLVGFALAVEAFRPPRKGEGL